MAEPATATYEEKVKQLSQLKLQAAQAERDVKNELKARKAAGVDPTCDGIINTYTAWAAGAGVLMAVPLLSGAAITGIQIAMIDKLAQRFGQNYSENEARNTLYAILGGLITPIVAGAPVTAIVSVVPLVGGIAGLVAGPALAAVATRLVGKAVVEHLQQGGKLADLDVAKARKDVENGLKAEAEKEAAHGGHAPA